MCYTINMDKQQKRQCSICDVTNRMIKVLIPPKNKSYNNDTKYKHRLVCSHCGARQ